MRFDAESFVEACLVAMGEDDPVLAVVDLVTRTVQDCGETIGDTLATLHRSSTLTVQRLCWGPGALTDPHEHRMWAVVGVYAGEEGNRFYDRDANGLRECGANVLAAGEVLALGPDAIHAAASVGSRWLGGLHVYGGDLFSVARSAWDPAGLERPYEDVASQRRRMLECIGEVAVSSGKALTVEDRRVAMLALWAASDKVRRHLDETEAAQVIRKALQLD